MAVMFVLQLRAFVLALYHNIGRQMGNPNRRIRGINTLPARALKTGKYQCEGRPGFRSSFHIILDLRNHIHRRERRMAPFVGVKR